MLFTDEEIFEAARTIRVSLPELLNAQTAQTCDRQLSDLLNSDDEAGEVAPQILEVLTAHDEIKVWLANFLGEAQKGFSPLAGEGSPVLADKFVCPVGNDYTWKQRTSAQQPPLCPTHQVPLIPVNQP
ncbi:hypothetical protein NDI45_24235 [Leptolyngbya sp. GB1-A1]|uniref:hypothetical protein n=1 Tax=Leptolyngbya sp. GB1-A1 TaxID=2933908 RepID=UPI0032997292